MRLFSQNATDCNAIGFSDAIFHNILYLEADNGMGHPEKKALLKSNIKSQRDH